MGIVNKILLLILIGLIGCLAYLMYQIIPGEQQNLQLEIEKNLPSVNASKDLVQFVQNMRFAKNNLSYYIYPDCTSEKIKRIKQAFEIISSETKIITFKQAEKYENKDITIFCSENQREIEKNKFIAGEGGPSEYLNLSLYPLIITGEILLYDTLYKDKCEYPVVEIHELLHVFGFDHIDKQESILYPYYSCDQRIDKEIVDELIRLYSIEANSDLFFKNASIIKKGIYLDFDVEIQNIGLITAEKVYLKVFSEDKLIDSFDLQDISPGTTKTLKIQNLVLPSRSLTKIKLGINSSTKEYFLENNALTAKV